jgi:hypothetical protein
VADHQKKRKSPDEQLLNGMRIDVATLYREVCRLGGMSASETAPLLCWKRIYELMWNATNTAGNPTAVSFALHTFYTTHLLAYQQAHPEDVSELLCPLCRKNEAPAGAVSPSAGSQLKWNQIWQECGNTACSRWLHKACAKTEGTASKQQLFCQDCFQEAGGAEPAKAPTAPRPAKAPSALAGAPRYMQLLPARPNMSSRMFGTQLARCVPLVESAERCDQLLRAARVVLCASGLTPELVAASLGFARDDMDVAYKTVALLVSGDTVLSGIVFCEDAHGNAAQILVAGTSQQARRAGCMRQLLQESGDWLAAKGVKTLCVGTTRSNTAAAEVYVRLGFSLSTTWPAGMVAKKTSSDLRDVWVLSRGQPPAAEKRVNPTPAKVDDTAVARRPRVAGDGLELEDGPPAEWPGEVPFTSGCVWPGLPQHLWPQKPCHSVVVKLIDNPEHPCCGAYGLFARRNLQPSGDLLGYGGMCRPAGPGGLFLTDCGGGLDVDAARCGNEARYLNGACECRAARPRVAHVCSSADYVGIAPRANAVMEAREAPLTGHRYVAVRLLEPIRAGAELLLDYGSDYPRHLFAAKSAKRRRLTAAGDHEQAPSEAAAADAQ